MIAAAISYWKTTAKKSPNKEPWQSYDYEKLAEKDLKRKVKQEEAELAILETYLPRLMEKGEVEKIAKAKKQELKIEDATKKGMLMSALMKDLKGKADGMTVKDAVDSLF